MPSKSLHNVTAVPIKGPPFYIYRMTRLISIVAGLAMLLSACSSDSGHVARKHFLWKVSDSNSSVFLLGSVHFADPSFYPLDSVIEGAFAASPYLAVELDVSDESVVSQIAAQSAKYAFLEEGRTLGQVLPAGLKASLDSLCRAWKIPSDALERLKPWAVAMSMQAVGIQYLGLNPELGIDIHFLRQAHAQGKEIVSLETVEEQVAALAGTGAADSVGVYYLRGVLHEIGKLDSILAGYVRAWEDGDDTYFAAIMEKEFTPEGESNPLLEREILERIYFSRNRKMAEAVSEFLEKDKSVFAVVGAAHLVGKESVVENLRRRGYKVVKM